MKIINPTDLKLSENIRQEQITSPCNDFDNPIEYFRTFIIDTHDEEPRYLEEYVLNPLLNDPDIISNICKLKFEHPNVVDKDQINKIFDCIIPIMEFHIQTEFEESCSIMELLKEFIPPVELKGDDLNVTKDDTYNWQRLHFTPTIVTEVGIKTDSGIKRDFYIIFENIFHQLEVSDLIDNIQYAVIETATILKNDSENKITN